MTLSFWIKSNKTGSGTCGLLQIDNSNKQFSTSYTINSADTWEYKTIAIPADTAGVINNDNGNGIQVEWWLNSGSTFTGGGATSGWESTVNNKRNGSNLGVGGAVSDYFAITGIQLEVGDVATPFEHESYGQTLAKCQRYYQKTASLFYGTPGSGSLLGYVNWDFKVSMRASPTITGGNGTWQNITPEFGNMYASTGTYPQITSGSTADAEL